MRLTNSKLLRARLEGFEPASRRGWTRTFIGTAFARMERAKTFSIRLGRPQQELRNSYDADNARKVLQAIMAPWSSSNHRPHCGSGCSRGRGRFRTAWRLIQRLFIGITNRPERRRLAVACQWDQRLPSPRGVGSEQIRRDAFSIFVEHQEGAMIWIKPEVALRTSW